MTTPKLHPAAVRAAERIDDITGGDHNFAVASVIHAAIDDHPNTVECARCVEWTEKFAERVRTSTEVARLEEKLFGHAERLKSEGWEELRKAAEAAFKELPVRFKSLREWVRFAQALIPVRGEPSAGEEGK